MAESSLEIDYSSHRPRRHHPTPARSYPHSAAFSFSSSYYLSHLPTPRRSSRNHIPTTPFASDSDTSWHGQLSWQFEPTGGWRDSRNLGAALSPWAAASATTNPSSQIFQRSANDYYLSNTANAYEYSGYDALLPSGRLELQSYVARDHESLFVGRTSSSSDSVVGRTSTSSHHEHKKSSKFLSLAAIKEGSSRNTGPLADKYDTSLIDYDATNDLQPPNTGIDPTSHRSWQPRWFSASHAYRDDDSDQDEINYGVHDHRNHVHVSMHNHGGRGHGHQGMLHDQLDYSNHRDGVSYNSAHGGLKSFVHGYGKHGHHSHDGSQSSSHHYRPGDHDGYDEIDRESGEDADEDDFGASRSVGLFSLFKYSTNFDILLVILGCVGSFINGGSLPGYSLLFGDFVDKIARDSISNKDQLMKDVEKVSFHCIYLLQRKWLLCSYM